MRLLERFRPRNGDATPSPNGVARGRGELAASASNLRAVGLSVREIATELEISRSYAADLLSDPDRSKAKARRERYGGRCVDCGAKTDGSNGRRLAPKRCASCTARFLSDNRYWNQDRVLAAIRRFAAEHGRPPVATEWLTGKHGRKGDGYPHVPTVIREFGSWAAAIEAAGFPRPSVGHNSRGKKNGPRIRTEELIQRILDASEVVHLAPSTADFGGTHNLLVRRGISWEEACEMAGVTPRSKVRKR